MTAELKTETVIYLSEGEGRHYSLGDMRAVFKADGEETADAYSISEWWLEPHSKGPGAHAHTANEDVFYVLEGCVSFFLDGERFDAGRGTFVRVPPGVLHDYENKGNVRAGFLNIYVPGGFEIEMPAIVEWFASHRDDND